MFSTLRRSYKERSPEDTIALIQGILSRHGLNPEVTFQANPYPEVYSVSIELPGTGFRTNGKGRTPEYCLASAYAEFMERLQNGLWLSLSRVLQSELKKDFGFYYSADEKFLSRRDFESLPDEIMQDMVHYADTGRHRFIEAYFDRLEERGAPGAVAVPFFSTLQGRNVLLPLNLMLISLGSNGMAAGNSREEALFQAFCELLERWGAAEVFYRQLTPPTVPETFLRQFKQEYRIIENIRASGKYRVSVRDFSAGLRIPAIGVMVENTEKQTYRLNVGCDTCFQVALSRSLTELYQGFTDEQMVDERLIPIPTQDPECFTRDDDAARFARYTIFCQFTMDNTGVFPTSLFGAEPSYEFDPAIFTQQRTYADEVRHLIAFFHAHNHDVYLRDVSFLGFPSVFVYVPEVSVLGRKNTVQTLDDDRSISLVEWDRMEERICRLKTLADDEVVQAASCIANFPPFLPFVQALNIKLKPESPWAQLPVSFLLAQMWYKVGRPEETLKALQIFRQGWPTAKEYYDAVEQYLRLYIERVPSEHIRQRLLTSTLPPEVVNEVCTDMANPAEVLSNVRLPACPACSSCELHEDCLTKAQLKVAHDLYPVIREQMPAQGSHLVT